jgi:hypothetical protein
LNCHELWQKARNRSRRDESHLGRVHDVPHVHFLVRVSG